MGNTHAAIGGQVDYQKYQATQCIGYIHPEDVECQGHAVAGKGESFHTTKVTRKYQSGVF